MSDNLLRVNNQDRLKDSSITSVSFGDKKNSTQKNKSENSILSFITQETDAKRENLILQESIPVEKPKLLDTIKLFVLFCVIDFALLLICFLNKNIFYTSIVMFMFCATVPISVVYFFYRLNTRNRIKMPTLVLLFCVGAFLYLFIDILAEELIIESLANSYLVVSIKSAVELILIMVVVAIAIQKPKHNKIMSVLLISSVVAAGFAFSRSLVEMFETLFVRVQISSNGTITSVGAIINNEISVENSINALINKILLIGIYKPALFIMLTVVNGFALRFMLYKGNFEKKSFGMWMLFIFSVVLNAFSSITSVIPFLKTLYMICIVSATIYVVYHIINYSIKQEIYK